MAELLGCDDFFELCLCFFSGFRGVFSGLGGGFLSGVQRTSDLGFGLGGGSIHFFLTGGDGFLGFLTSTIHRGFGFFHGFLAFFAGGGGHLFDAFGNFFRSGTHFFSGGFFCFTGDK